MSCNSGNETATAETPCKGALQLLEQAATFAMKLHLQKPIETVALKLQQQAATAAMKLQLLNRIAMGAPQLEQ